MLVLRFMLWCWLSAPLWLSVTGLALTLVHVLCSWCSVGLVCVPDSPSSVVNRQLGSMTLDEQQGASSSPLPSLSSSHGSHIYESVSSPVCSFLCLPVSLSNITLNRNKELRLLHPLQHKIDFLARKNELVGWVNLITGAIRWLTLFV